MRKRQLKINRVLSYSYKSSLAINLNYESEVTILQRHVALKEKAINRLLTQIGREDEKFAYELVAVDETIVLKTAAEQYAKV